MPKRRKLSSGPPKFKVGDRVRVKHGVADPVYPDIPLGGWAGVVAEVFRRRHTEYLLEWAEETLENAHPVFKKRCLRDGASVEEAYLQEKDLEPDRGEPLAMEQPTNLVTAPLSPDDQDDRVRAVFGLTSDDPLPELDEESQQRYCDWLKEHLQFPFEAEYWDEPEPAPGGTRRVTVTGISEEFPIDECDGVICEVRRGERRWEVPLCDLEVEEDHPNAQTIDDYSYWFWESYSEDEPDDESDDEPSDEDSDDEDEFWSDSPGDDEFSLDEDEFDESYLDDADILPPATIRLDDRREPARNDPCSCGSGKKYKHCCLKKKKG